MERPTLKSQIEAMRRQIQENGQSTVGCEELRVLCPDEVLVSSQWNAIAKIAKSEGWSFTYFPNGSVSFAKSLIQNHNSKSIESSAWTIADLVNAA